MKKKTAVVTSIFLHSIKKKDGTYQPVLYTKNGDATLIFFLHKMHFDIIRLFLFSSKVKVEI
ncbi:hypothetical protein BDF21DRAFT_413982 [Thamnidium elegans]|nr:hypothetical protein BDF21DRAFT_413982 [Thamnidium elegans]